MEPKKKSVEIVDKMQNIIIDVYSGQFENSKKCAILCVNEIIKELKLLKQVPQEHTNVIDYRILFYNDVLIEIQKLKKLKK